MTDRGFVLLFFVHWLPSFRVPLIERGAFLFSSSQRPVVVSFLPFPQPEFPISGEPLFFFFLFLLLFFVFIRESTRVLFLLAFTPHPSQISADCDILAFFSSFFSFFFFLLLLWDFSPPYFLPSFSPPSLAPPFLVAQ